ncbi:MAG: phosphate acyltransferase PlsX [Pseudomonadota bacterium]
MATSLVIAVDAMGGDAGPIITVGGAAIIARRRPDAAFRFYGDEAQIRSALSRHRDLARRATIIHTDVAIAMDAKPSQALRQGRRTSSMWLAIQAVKDGEADVAVSAGNTGALMAMSKFCLKTLRGIDRPAIAAIWPTVASECIVLDVGANVGATSRQLSEFALMGAAMARALFRLERPRVGLLNIGEEEVKGLDQVKAANTWLRESGLAIDHKGFIEGDQIGHGAADVIVTEGFSGNIALKTAEGTARQIASYLRAAMTRTWLTRIGAFLAQGGFAYLKKKMDPRRLNGGVFLGLNGIVIKSHGGTDETGFASALELGYDMARSGLLQQISSDLERVADLERAGDQPRRRASDARKPDASPEPARHIEPAKTAAS